MSGDLVAGQMIAYRTWTIFGDGLAPLSGGGAEDGGWSSRIAIAECRVWRGADPHPHPGQGAPVVGCTCGLYAYYSPLSVKLASAPAPDPFTGKFLPASVFGAVEVSGRVILATRGLRAERMRILGLVMPDSSTEARLAAHYYDVPTYPSQWNLLLDFPPQDYSGLVDVDEREAIPSFRGCGSASANLASLLASLDERASPPSTGTAKVSTAWSSAKKWLTGRRKPPGG